MLALMLEATVASLWSVANIGAGIWIGAGPGPDCASELLSSWIWIWIWYTPGALPTSRDELFNGHLRSPPSRVFQVAHPPTRGIAETSGLGGVVVFGRLGSCYGHIPSLRLKHAAIAVVYA